MKKILVFVVALVLFSCKNIETPFEGLYFYFEKPQPLNEKELSKFPSNYLGSFTSIDSTSFEINENSILKFKNYTGKISFQDYNVMMDSMKDSEKEIIKSHQMKFRKLKDSVQESWVDIDTFFKISENQKLKKIKNSLVLNFKDSLWDIKILSLNKKALTLKDIYSFDDLSRLDSLSKQKSKPIDSSKYIFNLSRNEFKKMLQLKHLGFDRVLIKK